MGILTMSGDALKYDRTKEDTLKNEFDPLSAAGGERVKSYDPELGYAVDPEEKAQAILLKSQVDSVSGQQQEGIDKYASEYNKNKETAAETAAGVLEKGKAHVASYTQKKVDTIAVNVTDKTGTKIEKTYYLPKSVAEALADEKSLWTSWSDDKKSFNVSVKVKGGKIFGEEIHTMLTTAQGKVDTANKIYEDAYKTAVKAGNLSLKGTDEEIKSQQKIAQDAYEQNINQAQQTTNQTKEVYTKYIEYQQKAFQDGLKTNAGGIADLVKSGALSIKSKVVR